MTFAVRRPSGPPQLAPLVRVPSFDELKKGVAIPPNAGLWTEEALAALQRFLRDYYFASEAGLPPGMSTIPATQVQAGQDATSGTAAVGWIPGDHIHSILTAIAVGLANLNAEGDSSALARANHTHKRDVRVKQEGLDIATRNALDFRNTPGIVWGITDDLPNDEVDVTIDVAGVAESAGLFYSLLFRRPIL